MNQLDSDLALEGTNSQSLQKAHGELRKNEKKACRFVDCTSAFFFEILLKVSDNENPSSVLTSIFFSVEYFDV